MTVLGEMVPFPADTGSRCQAWDDNRNPECQSSSPPEWCQKSWCFVDPCSCSGDSNPQPSKYSGGKFQGREIYFSYSTCGSEDETTGQCATLGSKKTCVANRQC